MAFGVFYLSACGGKEDSNSVQALDEGNISSTSSPESQEANVSDESSDSENKAA